MDIPLYLTIPLAVAGAMMAGPFVASEWAQLRGTWQQTRYVRGALRHGGRILLAVTVVAGLVWLAIVA